MKESAAWRLLIGTGIGERTQAFLRGLSWTLPAAMVSRVLAGFATLFTARQLGPPEFGNASLVLATTYWIQVPLFLGLPTALMRFVPVAKPEEREEWINAGLSLLLLSSGLTLGIGFAFAGSWAQAHGVTPSQFKLGLLWCLTFLFFTTSTVLAAASERFRLRGILEILFSALFLCQILYLWFFKMLDASWYVRAMVCAYALAGLSGLAMLKPRRFIVRDFREKARAFLVFGLIASGGSFASALLQSAGRLIANQYLDISQVGLLSAYQAGSQQMAVYFAGLSLQVFMPIAARTPDRPALFSKLIRVSILVIIGTATVCAVVLAGYFWLLGPRYQLGLAELTVFALTSGLATQHGLLSWFFSSGGSRGVMAAVVVALIAGILNAVLAWFWIPRWGLVGAGAASGVAYGIGILACYIPTVKRYGFS